MTVQMVLPDFEPTIAGSEPKDFVVCRICGKTFQQITTNGHLRKHDMTFGEYRSEFPEAPTMSGKSRKKLSEIAIEYCKDPKVKAKMSEIATEQHRNPKSVAKHKAAMNRPDVIVKLSAANIERWKDPEFRASRIGPNNPNWKGGPSLYCLAFNDGVKEHIRNLCSRTCTVCGESIFQYFRIDSKTWARLHVDHLDENKMQGCDNWEWRLTSLCRSCHSKMQNQNRHLLLQLLLINNKRHQTNFLFENEEEEE